MDGAKRPRPTTRFRGTDLGDEYVFYDDQQDQVHVLNATAREIFLLCDGQRSADEIGRAFAGLYEDSGEDALQDALAILDELVELGLLDRSA